MLMLRHVEHRERTHMHSIFFVRYASQAKAGQEGRQGRKSGSAANLLLVLQCAQGAVVGAGDRVPAGQSRKARECSRHVCAASRGFCQEVGKSPPPMEALPVPARL